MSKPPPEIPPETIAAIKAFSEHPAVKAVAKQMEGFKNPVDGRSVKAAADAFEACAEALRNPPVARKPKRGRPRGTSPITRTDEPLLAEMHELICGDEAFSISDAGRRVSDKAEGNSPDAIIYRLRRGYVKRYNQQEHILQCQRCCKMFRNSSPI
jgi:hypothetical protein